MKPDRSDFDYPLDESLIAQAPLERRDESRLMVLDRGRRRYEHRTFSLLPVLLKTGDLLVVNDTRVVPAKFVCRRRTGGRIEGLFLREETPGTWEVLLKNASRCSAGERLAFQDGADIEVELIEDRGAGRWSVSTDPRRTAPEILAIVGRSPLPPYIRREDESTDAPDRLRYQTVYADRPGAVAAPTAGLHFSEELFRRLREAGIECVKVTLHVGMGTFAPVKADDLASHEMHREWYDLPASSCEAINAARREGRRIVAVGTTSVRVLESAAREQGFSRGSPALGAESGWTDLFLYPPSRFHVVDALITNFHLPCSTLLMLVAAFCSPGKTDGIATILEAYSAAVNERYRFYSYGDAMLIE